MQSVGTVACTLLVRARALLILTLACLTLATSGCSGCGGSSTGLGDGNVATLSGIALDPPSATMAAGAQARFGATETFSDGSAPATPADARFRPLTWTMEDPSVATVNGAGLVTAVHEGTTNVVATDPTTGVRATASVAVGTAVFQSLEVTPTAATAPRKTTQAFVAMAVFTDGTKSDVTARVTWASGDAGVAAIGADGVATALAAGQTLITAKDPATRVTASVTFTVTDVALDSITVTPSTKTVGVGAITPFVATGTFHDGSTKDLTASVTWSSSATNVATFSSAPGSAGMATAIAPGTTTLTAVDPSGVSGSATLTVTGITLRSIAITPPSPSIPRVATQLFAATGTFSDGTTADLTARVAWSSSSAAVATISNAAGTEGRATAASPGTTTITATDAASGVTASTTLVVTSATLASISVTPPAARIGLGTVQSFLATGTYTDGTTRDLTAAVTWTSSDGGVASVSNAAGNAGIASAATSGTTTITATDAAAGLAESAKLTVTTATLRTVAVTPPSASVPRGATQSFVATGTFGDGTTKDLTAAVAWSSSQPSVASISSATGSAGLATALAAGTTTITATVAGVSATATLMVTTTTLKSLAITPAAPTLANGTSLAFVATGTYADGTTRALTGSVTWSSSDAGVATVSNAAGTRGVATAASAGTTTITAIDPATGITATASLTVTASALVTVTVTPPSAVLPIGSTHALVATGTYADGTHQSLTQTVTWSSSNPAVASVSNAAGSRGVVTALSAGTATVNALDPASGQKATATVTVTTATLKSLAVTPPDPTVAKDGTQAFVATATYSDGSHADVSGAVTWSSSDAAIAWISNAAGTRGVATAVAAGTVTITAIDAATGMTATATMHVTTATLRSVAIAPPDPTLPTGATQAFVATGTYSDGSTKDLTASTTWASSAPSVATISNAPGTNGLATAAAAGTSTITATDPATGMAGTTTLTVTSAVLRRIDVTPPGPRVPSGSTQAFVAVGTYSDGSTRTLTTSVTWSSSATSIASIGNAAGAEGLATALSAGTTTITAADPVTRVAGTATLTVSSATLRGLAVTPASATVATGSKQAFTAVGSYSDGTTRTLTTSVTWTSSSPSVASVSNAAGNEGVATAAAAGTATVTATDAATGLTATATLKVTAATLKSLSLTPPSATVPNGATQAFAATGTYSDGTTQALTAAVTWSSSAPSVATVSNAAGTQGVATAASVGTTTITATDPASGVTATATLGVSDIVLRAIAVTPGAPTLPAGTTQAFIATGTFSDGTTRVLTTSVTWSSSVASVATIANAAGTQGVATTVAAGTTTITATDSTTGASGATSLKVTSAALRSIAITPAGSTVSNGTSQTFTATGTYSDGSTRTLTTAVTWASSAAAVATISNAAGTQGVASAASAGTTTITATDPASGVSGSTTLKVTAATLRSIKVTPASASVRNGTSQSFVAVGTYSDGSSQTLTSAVTWSTSDPAVASVSNAAGTQGVATGTSIGTATVTATDVASGIQGAATLTVTAAVLRSIAVTPIDPSVVSGATQAFIATGTFTDGTTRPLTSAVTWTSSQTAVAGISNAAGTQGLATASTPGTTVVTATEATSGIKGTMTLTVTAAVLRSLAITPASASTPSGTTQAFVATGTFSDGSTRVVTTTVAWSSSAPALVTISNAAGTQGVATGLAVGTATLQAKDAATGTTATATLTVTAPVLRSIAVTPPSPSVPKGATQTFAATGTYTDGTTANLTTAVTWSSSAPSIATISNASGTQGIASALSAGSTTIAATDPATGTKGTAAFNVSAAALRSLAITPPAPSIPNGTTQVMTATGTFSDGTTRSLTAAVTWASSAPAIASISNAAGSQGVVAAASVGTTTISATDPSTGIVATTSLTVTAGVLRSIALTPPAPSIPKGTTQAMVATGTYSDGTTKPLTTMVSWTSSAVAVATISSAAGSEGIASALSVGTTTLTATEPGTGIAGSVSLSVTAAVLRSIAITPSSPAVPTGATQAFIATGTFSDGTTQTLTAQVTWTSSAPSIASISNAAGTRGVATAASVGSTTIAAADPASGIAGSTTLRVTAAVLRSLAITPASPSIPSGTSQAFVATGTFSDGTTRALTTSVTWTSSSTTVATISNAAGTEGVASSASVGTTSITATDPATSISATATLAVTAARLRSIAVTPPAPSIPNGTTQAFVATGTYTDGTTRALTGAATWTSSSTAVATISNAAGSQGIASAASAGSTTITATDPSTGLAGTAALSVTAGFLKSIAITPATTSIANGTTQAFVATGTYSDGSTRAVTASVTWASSSTAVATLSNAAGTQGVATAASLGTTTVTAVDPPTGATASATLRVTAAVLRSVAVTPPTPSIPNGTTQAFVATGTYTDGTTQTLTTSVTWSSSATAVATLSNAAGSQGIATSASVGSATVTATDPATSLSGAASLTVSAAVLRSLAITPPTPSIPNGTTQAFVATGTYSDGTTRAVTAAVTWASSSTAIAAISNAGGTQGIATAASVGTTMVTATDPGTGIAGAATLTVTPAVLRSIGVTPPTPSIPKGTAQTFIATGTYSDGTTRALTTAVTWASSVSSVATISNAAGTQGIASSVSVGTTSVTATDPATGVVGTATLKVTPAVLVRVAVTPATPSIPNGTTQLFIATGTYSDGTTRAVTTSVTWASSSTTIATISNAAGTQGKATGAALGTTTISATDPSTGISGSTTLTVTAAVLRAVDVSPAAPSVAKGYTQAFVATGTYTDGTTANLTTSVTWASATPAVATISNAAGTSGVASTVATGTSVISATDPSTSLAGSATLTVTPATLASIQVTPATPTVPVGNTAVMTATGTYSDGTTRDLTAGVTWSSSVTSVATISNASGSEGLASTALQGTTVITALQAASGISGTTTMTVTPAMMIAIQITPTNPVVPRASQQQFYATGIYNNGLSYDLTTAVTWSSSNTATGTISNALGTEGLATTIASGTSTITALDPSSGLSGTTTLNVNTAVIVSIAVTPAPARVAIGARVQFTATATYNNGSTRDVTQYVSWTSSAPGTASVSNAARRKGSGLGKKAGTATINATDTASGISGTAALTVSSATLVSLAVAPAGLTIPKNTSQQFRATGTFTDGSTADMTAGASWTSSSTAVATITSTGNSQGYASGVGVGAATITAVDPGTGISASTTLNVSSAFLRSIAITPSSPSMYVGLSRSITATGTFSDGSTKDITLDVTWLTASTSIATVSNQILTKGTVTGVAAGSTSLNAIFPLTSVSASTTLTVIP
jgi:uncharacterized protein YjdB